MRWTILVVGLACAGCQAEPPAVVTPPPFTPAATRPTDTPTQPRGLSVAVAVASPTATVALVGDYPTLVRPRIDAAQQALGRVEQQLGQLRQAPIRIAQSDWRSQMQTILDDLASANGSLKALGARTGTEAALYAEVSKVVDDLDFVVSEYRMAFDFDPDGTHFLRANRAEKSTADEVESIRAELQRHIGSAPSPTPAR